MSKPLNEHKLWKGKIQLANYPPAVEKPPMNLLPLTYHGGQETIDGAEYTRIKNEYCDPKMLTKGYEDYSKKYWEGIRTRNAIYRANADRVS